VRTQQGSPYLAIIHPRHAPLRARHGAMCAVDVRVGVQAMPALALAAEALSICARSSTIGTASKGDAPI
ncbi:MAG: hypothetical protein ACKOUM_10965, partial [Sphingopyxis sp.]